MAFCLCVLCCAAATTAPLLFLVLSVLSSLLRSSPLLSSPTCSFRSFPFVSLQVAAWTHRSMDRQGSGDLRKRVDGEVSLGVLGRSCDISALALPCPLSIYSIGVWCCFFVRSERQSAVVRFVSSFLLGGGRPGMFRHDRNARCSCSPVVSALSVELQWIEGSLIQLASYRRIQFNLIIPSLRSWCLTSGPGRRMLADGVRASPSPGYSGSPCDPLIFRSIE